MRCAFTVRRLAVGLAFTTSGTLLLAALAAPAPAQAGPTQAGPTQAGPTQAGPTQEAGAHPDGANPDGALQDGAVPAQAPQAAESATTLASVLVDTAHPTCWPTANSPAYADEVHQGDVLRVGEERDGFRQVLLPLGPQGYVHKDFATAPQDGKVVSKGKAVSFRYRPRSGEAPVALLSEGTELWVVGEDGDWWRVRDPARDCWLPAGSVEVFADPPATMQKAYDELAKVQRGEVQARIDAAAARAAALALEAGQREQLSALLDTFQVELQKSPKEQQLDGIAQATDALLADVGEESPLWPNLLDLQRRIATQRWVVEAVSVRDAEPVPATDLPDPPTPLVRDPLERFQAVGFLRWEKGLVGPGRYVIEKGRQPLYLVTCDSGRYDLAVYVDREIGLVGSRRRPATDSLRVLDIEKIEVLNPNR